MTNFDGARLLIPKRLHYIWVGTEIPDDRLEFIESWRSSNPSYEIAYWNEDSIDMLNPMIQRAYRKRQWATVADIARLQVIYEHGGIYLDTDFRVLRPLDSLLHYRCFFAFQHEHHPTDWVSNAAFGAMPRHPLVGATLHDVMRIKPRRFGLDRPTDYGPKLLTRSLRDHWGVDHYDASGSMVRDVFLCPTTYFFPFSYEEEFREDCIRSDTLAVHFWKKSWIQQIPAPVRWAKGASEFARKASGHGP